jgi:DNA-binding NarL/FixJ family response regulator
LKSDHDPKVLNQPRTLGLRRSSECHSHKTDHVEEAKPDAAMSEPAPKIRVALVEDRQEERDALSKLFNRTTGFECTAACDTAREALAVLPDCRPDIALVDINLPDESGIECVRKLRALLPQAQFMMLTAFEDHDKIFGSLSAGATGYLLKTTSPGKLLEAVQELHAGGAPMSGQIARQVISVFQPSSASTASEALSGTEQRVLDLLARGLLYKEVAEALKISTSTVRTHVWHIYRKLQAHNRTEAILKAKSRRRIYATSVLHPTRRLKFHG